jgi:hypothetical protein
VHSFSSNGSGSLITITITTMVIIIIIIMAMMITRMFIKLELELSGLQYQGLCTSQKAQVGPPRLTVKTAGADLPLVLSPEL